MKLFPYRSNDGGNSDGDAMAIDAHAAQLSPLWAAFSIWPGRGSDRDRWPHAICSRAVEGRCSSGAFAALHSLQQRAAPL